MGKRNGASVKDVAKMAGVSQSTVSMILNNYENVSFSDATRQRVLDACNTLGYKSPALREMQSEKILLVVLPSCDNPSYTKQVAAVHSKATEKGYTCVTLNTYRNPRAESSVLKCLMTMPLAGAIFLYQPENISVLERANSLKPCVVVCDRNLNVKLDTIEVNSFGIGQLIAEHMIRQGHTSVTYIATSLSPKYVTRVQRLEGIKETYRKNGYPQGAVKVVTLQSEEISPRGMVEDYAAGILLTNRVLDKYRNDITGIIGYNDMICLGIIDAIKIAGYHVPQDYSVIGCDNISLAELSSISLTTVEHYSHLRARDATELLIKKIEEAEDNSIDVSTTGVTRVEFEPKLVIRNSTKNISKKSHV